jgi:hypothetical protein
VVLAILGASHGVQVDAQGLAAAHADDAHPDLAALDLTRSSRMTAVTQSTPA